MPTNSPPKPEAGQPYLFRDTFADMAKNSLVVANAAVGAQQTLKNIHVTIKAIADHFCAAKGREPKRRKPATRRRKRK